MPTPCAKHYGLDTSDYSFSYVATWSSGRELSELKASLETIRSTASELIKDIDKNFAELTRIRSRRRHRKRRQKNPRRSKHSRRRTHRRKKKQNPRQSRRRRKRQAQTNPQPTPRKRKRQPQKNPPKPKHRRSSRKILPHPRTQCRAYCNNPLERTQPLP